jgi:hypothetical protein
MVLKVKEGVSGSRGVKMHVTLTVCSVDRTGF